MDNKKILKCHCGAVSARVRLADGLRNLRRCTCSMCSRRGAVMASVPLEDLFIDKGETSLSLYQFNTHTAKHYFCSVCGIYTHHQRRSNPKEFGINVACLEGVRVEELGQIEFVEGRLHPKDLTTGEREK